MFFVYLEECIERKQSFALEIAIRDTMIIVAGNAFLFHTTQTAPNHLIELEELRLDGAELGRVVIGDPARHSVKTNNDFGGGVCERMVKFLIFSLSFSTDFVRMVTPLLEK
ncbi:MAG: hypothetical protein ONB44_17385 [candidate division KSB1 bacterium]|nr:hypothetical protein [candidate division KSB1 bacterium]